MSTILREYEFQCNLYKALVKATQSLSPYCLKAHFMTVIMLFVSKGLVGIDQFYILMRSCYSDFYIIVSGLANRKYYEATSSF